MHRITRQGIDAMLAALLATMIKPDTKVAFKFLSPYVRRLDLNKSATGCNGWSAGAMYKTIPTPPNWNAVTSVPLLAIKRDLHRARFHC